MKEISIRELDELLEDLGTLRLDDVYKVYGDSIELMIKVTRQYKALKLARSPLLEWVKCKRKSGSEFLKLIYYCPDVDGNVEAGRFNMSTQEQVSNDWNIDQILEELMSVRHITTKQCADLLQQRIDINNRLANRVYYHGGGPVGKEDQHMQAVRRAQTD